MFSMQAAEKSRSALRKIGAKALGRLVVTFTFALSAWSGQAQANAEALTWADFPERMEPPSNVNTMSRLNALLTVSLHDALNAIPGKARYETYLPAVAAASNGSPEAAMAAAGRTILLKYIAFYGNPANVNPPYLRPALPSFIPQVEAAYAQQLAAVPDGPGKVEGIRVGELVANNLWNERFDDGWNNPLALTFAFPNNDGDNNPMTGLPGEYVRLNPQDTAPGAPQPSFFWWGDVRPWTMETNEQFRVDPPPSPTNRRFRRDVEETRAYGALGSTVRTAQQAGVARWWGGGCVGLVASGPDEIMRQVIVNEELDNYEAARVLALAGLAQADALISNVNSKNYYNFWRPITAINYFYPGTNWRTDMFTPPNQEYPAGHPMYSSAVLNVLMREFGKGRLDVPVYSPSPCGDLVFNKLPEAVDSVIDARVWGGMHFRGSGEVGAKAGEKIAKHVYKEYLKPLRGHHGHHGHSDDCDD